MSRKTKALEFVDDVYNISVTGRHVLVTDAMKDYAIEKISKIERFWNRILDVQIIMDIQRYEHRVDIIMHAGHTAIKATGITDDMYVSIDEAVKRLETQLLRWKTKLQDHHARGTYSIDMDVNILAPNYEEDYSTYNNAIDTLNEKALLDQFKPHKIVSKKSIPLKALSYDEAIMKMELSQDHFLLFRCESDRKLKLIYRRDDGHYGIIEIELEK